MGSDLINLFDYEAAARECMQPAAYDYVAGGAADEVSLRRPRTVFDAMLLRPRMMVDVTRCDLSTTVLGTPVPWPILVAPTGDHGIAHPDGELATARATGAAGTVMIVSSGSTYPMAEIAKAATGPLWCHLPLFKDRGVIDTFVARAEENGFEAICLTIDHKVAAKRERNMRNRWSAPLSPNLAGIDLAGIDRPEIRWDPKATAVRTIYDELFDRSATWSYVQRLTSATRLPVIAKGVLDASDAVRAVEAGVAAVIVSDHGGRQLDTTPAPVEVLPEVAEAVGDRAEVYVDGGIRRGTDVVKALALGARAVLIGRPVLWGLAVGGDQGVTDVLEILRDELDVAMVMCGRPSIANIDRDLVAPVSPLWHALGGLR